MAKATPYVNMNYADALEDRERFAKIHEDTYKGLNKAASFLKPPKEEYGPKLPDTYLTRKLKIKEDVKESLNLTESRDGVFDMQRLTQFSKDLKGRLFELLADICYDYEDISPIPTEVFEEAVDYVLDRFCVDDGLEEGLAGAVAGGAIGAAVGKNPSTAMKGAEIGSAVQDAFKSDDKEETNESYSPVYKIAKRRLQNEKLDADKYLEHLVRTKLLSLSEALELKGKRNVTR